MVCRSTPDGRKRYSCYMKHKLPPLPLNFSEQYVLKRGRRYGFDYLIMHNGIGHRCGYVCIPKDHPWYGRSDNDLSEVNVHGGLTFSDIENGIHWIGFDCAHSLDAPDLSLLKDNTPLITHLTAQILLGGCRGEVRNTAYVLKEITYICRLAHRVQNP